MVRGQVIEEGDRANIYAIEPEMYVDEAKQFGFNKYAEILNGRLAMIGFVCALVVEITTGQGLLHWLTQF